MATKRLEVLITGNAKDAQKAFGALGDSAEKGGRRTTRALSGIQSGLIGLGVGAAALGSFKAFEESERIARQTAAVIKSTGNEANVTEGHISDLASEMSKLGGVDDELVQQGENMLLTFTKVRNEAGKGNDVFDQATRAANDYAAATGTDVVNANKMLGKALNDPIKGLTALTRAGVSFTQQQKDQIRALVDAGDTLGAQKIILAEFNKEYGGSLEANATASGKAQVAMENLGESAGAILAPGLELLAGGAAKAAEGLSGLPVPLQQGIVGATGLTAAAVYLVPKLIETASTMKDGVGAARDWSKAMRESGKLSTLTSGVGVAAAGVGAFTLTLEALNRAADSGIDVAGLTEDLVQLGEGSAEISDVLRTMIVDTDGLAAAFGQASRSPRDFGEAFDYLRSNLAPGGDWNGSDLRKAQDQVHDLDAALAGAVKDGNAEAAAKAYQKLAGELVQQGIAVDEFASLMPQYNAEMDRAQRGNEGLAGAAETTASKIAEQEGQAAKAARTSDQAAESHKRNADALKRIADEAEQATSNIRDFYDESTNQVSDQIDVERALDAASQSFKDNGTALSISAEKGRQNREAIIAARDAQVEYAMTLRDTSGSNAAIESMVNYSNRLYDTMLQAGFTKEQAAALIGEMGLTPTDIFTTFGSNATEAEAKAADVRQSIENVPGWKDIYFNALTDEAKAKIAELSQIANEVGGSVLSGTAGAAIQQSQQAHIGHKAGGGSFKKGDWDWVGENGPELVNWGGNGVVIPANKSKQLVNTIREDEPGWNWRTMGNRRGGGSSSSVIHEDDPGWDWRTMGNRRRGPTARQTLDFRTGTTVNPGNPGLSGGSFGGGAPITVNVFESKNARATAREVVAEINRQTRMGRSPLVGA